MSKSTLPKAPSIAQVTIHFFISNRKFLNVFRLVLNECLVFLLDFLTAFKCRTGRASGSRHCVLPPAERRQCEAEEPAGTHTARGTCACPSNTRKQVSRTADTSAIYKVHDVCHLNHQSADIYKLNINVKNVKIVGRRQVVILGHVLVPSVVTQAVQRTSPRRRPRHHLERRAHRRRRATAWCARRRSHV